MGEGAAGAEWLVGPSEFLISAKIFSSQQTIRILFICPLLNIILKNARFCERVDSAVLFFHHQLNLIGLNSTTFSDLYSLLIYRLIIREPLKKVLLHLKKIKNSYLDRMDAPGAR